MAISMLDVAGVPTYLIPKAIINAVRTGGSAPPATAFASAQAYEFLQAQNVIDASGNGTFEGSLIHVVPV